MADTHEEMTEARTRTPSLINRAAVRRLALDASAKHRNGKFKWIRDEFYTEVELVVRRFVIDRVMRQGPGKTLH